MFSICTTEAKLTELCLEGEEWYDIIRNQRSIFLQNGTNSWDLTNQVLLKLHLSGINLDVNNTIFTEVVEGDATSLGIINPAYIIECTNEDAQTIEEKYGVICIPQDKIKKPIVAKRGWRLDTSDNTKPHNWNYFLQNIGTKSNSLVLVDRYFFAKEHGESLDDALFNLCEILNSILPSKQVKNYIVSVIFDLAKTNCQMKDLATKVNKLKKRFIGKTTFDIELISINSNCYKYDETHDRKIISNYFIIDASHKLRAFSENNRSLCNQVLSFDYLYSDGIEINSISSIPEKTQDRILNAISESIETSSREIIYAINGRVGDDGAFELKNPLLRI